MDKASKAGVLKVIHDTETNTWATERCSLGENDEDDALLNVFEDGELIVDTSLKEIQTTMGYL